MRSVFPVVFGVFVLSAGFADAQFGDVEPPPEEYRRGFQSIQEKQAKAWLNILADDFQGRGTGQAGYMKAAHFAAGKLAQWGWEPAGENGTYFQMTPLIEVATDAERSVLKGPDGLELRAPLISFEMDETPSLKGKLAVVNVAGQETAIPEDVEIQGRIVVLVRQQAGRSLLRSLLRKRPAALIRVVDQPPQSTGRVSRPSSTPRRRRGGLGAASLHRPAAVKLLQSCGLNPELLEPRETPGVTSQLSDVELEMQVWTRTTEIGAPNVVAWYPGADPELRDEFVGFGAHLDHLGHRGGDLFPGANDNGSGSTAILQIARAISLNPKKPKRSVLYIAFAAEELGLLGSRHFCANPTRPLDKMHCLLNMDMVGRNEEKSGETAEENEGHIHLVGSKVIPSTLHDLTMKANRCIQFEFEYDEEQNVARRSDQASFLQKGVPVTFLFGGFTPRYHQPTDVPQQINLRKIVSAARLNYLTLMFAAEQGVQKQASSDQ